MRWHSAAHFAGGFLAALAARVEPVLAVVATALFVIYELDQDWHLHDKAYKDIREYMVGFFAALAAMLLWP